MSNAFSGGFTNLFSRKPIIETPSEASSQHDLDRSDRSITSVTKRMLFPESPMMLIPTPAAQSPPKPPPSPKQVSLTPTRARIPPKRASPSVTPKKASPELSPKRPPSSPRISPKVQAPSAAQAPPPSPFRSIGKAIRMTSAGIMVMGNNHAPEVNLSSNQSVTSTASQFSQGSLSASQPVRIRDPPKIRVKLKNHKGTRGQSPKRKCASCVCRDQKLVDQRKEIDHLKDVINDLLVMGMESKSSMAFEDTDDESLEDLPLPEILGEQTPHQGDLIKASAMALSPTRRAFEVDPEDPLKNDQVASTTAVLQMSHSLQVKQAYKRGNCKDKMPEKIRHLRIQVNGSWGYYSGPTPEADEQLIGCVVRFDNGDLYLGNMENSCFHGPGAYYPKGGKAFRGTFVWNQLSEYEC
ncbi:MAG: hypothetical protein SGBAC_004869 [Bacillariaceae sp.]